MQPGRRSEAGRPGGTRRSRTDGAKPQHTKTNNIGPKGCKMCSKGGLFCSKILFPQRTKTGKIEAFMMKIGAFVEIIFP